MKLQNLLQNIKRLLNEDKIPKEITDIIDRIYLDYNDAYRNCLSNISHLVEENPKLMEELSHITSYMSRDYEEDIECNREIEEIAYCSKKEKNYEDIQIVIRNLVAQRGDKNRADGESLRAIIDVDEIEEDEESKTIQRNVNNDVINTEFCREIKGSILSEIDSSRKILISKLFNISKQVDVTYVKDKFSNEVEIIKNSIQDKLFISVKESLNEHDIDIANKIYSLYIQYIKENENEVALSTREKFVRGLQFKVDEQKAVKEQIRLENNIKLKSLDEDVIK